MKKYSKILFAAGAVAAGVGAGYGICCLADDFLFNRNTNLPPALTQKISGCDNSHLGEYLQKNLKWVEDYGYERHTIISDRGEKLRAYLLKPEKESGNYIFCAHGYKSYGKKEFSAVAQYYIERGYNVFFPDHVASGESEGTYCTFGHYERADCFKWLSYMRDNFGEDISIVLHGVSMGAATVMMMSDKAELPDNVKGIIADCGFTNAVQFFADKLSSFGISSEKVIRVMNEVNKKRAGFDFYTLSPIDCVKNAKLPFLFIHGEKDALVPCYMAGELYESCGSNKKEILIVEDADHAQSYKVGEDIYKEKMDAFLTEIL